MLHRHIIYLRVVGASDTQCAQAEKLVARDRALAAISGKRSLPARVLALRRTLAEGARISLVKWAPDRQPKRRTVQITLGAGSGANWWGLLYPEGCGECSSGSRAQFTWPLLSFLLSLFR